METSKWKWFRYQDIFDIQKWKRLTKSDMYDGIIPFIWATDNNNGVTEYISNDEYLHSENVITVSYNGSIGNAFYQEKPFWASDDINVLYPKFLLNKNIASFLITVIEKEKYRFSYWNKWDRKTMLISKVKLPVLSDNSPDWNWIENYVKNTLIPQLPQTAQELFSDDFVPKTVSPKKLTLDTKSWKWFRYEEIFDICIWKSIDLNKLEQSSVGINYVARTEDNNGITATVIDDDTFEVYDGACLTVPMVGNELKASYQIDRFCVSQNIAIFRPKHQTLNAYTGVFFNTLIRKDIFRFAYGRTLSLERIKMLKIKLPITPTWTPDWQWMEDYIKSLPYSVSL